MVMLQLRQLVVNPGQRIELQEVNWNEFEAILEELSASLLESNGIISSKIRG